MRKFIISDLHGNGDVYDSIMGYLDNISLTDEVELYINGDLIDRGLDGFSMLIDVIERIAGKGDVTIHYLGGNHELMMYEALNKRKPGKSVSKFCDWMLNGGGIIEGELDVLEEDGEELCDSLRDFLGELELYKIFDEKINNKNILLVHACPPEKVFDDCHLKIKDNNKEVFDTVWKREYEDTGIFFLNPLFKNNLGKDGYFVIKGHTPLKDVRGFDYDPDQNYLNIDGGCSYYACGMFGIDHVPLVEIKEDKLEILVFNHNNEIVDGYEFDGEVKPMSDEELNNKDKYIDHQYDNSAEINKLLIKKYLNLK